MVSTADVRPIEEVIGELRALLVRKLPGSQAVYASWCVLNRSAAMIEMAKQVFDKDDHDPTPRSGIDKRVHDTYVWKTHGEYYAACQMIHALADAFKVSSFKPGTVFE